MDFTLVCCLLISGLGVARALPGGAPAKACAALLPMHTGISPSTETVPYTFTFSQSTYTPGKAITVTITTSNEQQYPIAGFLLQGRRTQGNTGTSVGTFSNPTGKTKLLTCNTAGDSFTHSAAEARGKTVQITWNPPSSDAGNIVIRGTVAASKKVFFGVLNSSEITYVKPSTGTATGPAALLIFVISSVMAILFL
ncbi:putative ferric-chelate reductase 1 [Gigantopelta aegis]|uniref:putative ferric-chelate reductase 1 n=1 Tax=Gigantopelta aegis TaxID=1735272 RepID=UPI001B889A47|nr:putative ferric-chelate reductase 1 [Gigantopelta aegis]